MSKEELQQTLERVYLNNKQAKQALENRMAAE